MVEIILQYYLQKPQKLTPSKLFFYFLDSYTD